jgi:uncharacterized spore protein YtfJ
MLTAGSQFNPGGGTDYYVSESGTGSGLSAATPMSPASFLLVVLVDADRVFFLEGDEF